MHCVHGEQQLNSDVFFTRFCIFIYIDLCVSYQWRDYPVNIFMGMTTFHTVKINGLF